MSRTRSGILAGLALLAGCDVAPHAPPPGLAVPAGWTEHADGPAALDRTETALRDWWRRFDDPLLTVLVEQAIANNRDVAAAGARLLAARALRDQIAGELYPQIDLAPAAGIQRYSTTLEFPPLPGISSDSRFWQYGGTASWQIDVFGRIRQSVQAQQDAVEAGIEQQRAVLLATVTELAADYVALRAAQVQVGIVDGNVRTADAALELARKLYDQGLGTTLQVAQAKAERETVQATRPELETRVAQLSHAIAVLAGRMPGSLEADLVRPAPLPAVPPFPVALPSVVIANRPDIRRAERQYAQATARIGVAVAQLYPQFSLPLSFTPQASMIHELFTASSLAWSLLIEASIPVWHGGRLSAQVREARANAEAARLAYEQAVLAGLREVEDRLVALNNDQRRILVLQDAARDDALALERARRLYQAGLSGFLDVLTGQRAVLAAQNALALARLARLSDAIGLFAAMGAGWQGVALTGSTLPVDAARQARLARQAADR